MTYIYTRPQYASGTWYSFQHKDVSLDRLPALIEAALTGKTFKGEAMNGDMSFIFVETLSAGDKTILDDTISNFTPVEPIWE